MQLEAKEIIAEINISKFQQVFIQLLLNAKEAIERKNCLGEILIKTKNDFEKLFIEICDNGSGIEKKDLPSVFDPFFSTKAVGKGSGLGLSIAHSIIESFAGRLYCDTVLGKGTTFTIELPLHSSTKELSSEIILINQK